jgi:hypothetical protein
VFVAEAVDVFAVVLGREGMVAGGDGARVDFVCLVFALDLWKKEGLSAGLFCVCATQHSSLIMLVGAAKLQICDLQGKPILPRSQCPDYHYHQTLCRQLEMLPSCDHPCVKTRGSTLANVLAFGCCGRDIAGGGDRGLGRAP